MLRKNRVRVCEAMEFVICDDNQLFMNELQHKIEEICAKRDWNYKCKLYQHVRTLLSVDLSSAKVVFLDIDMPEVNGIEAAKILRDKYPDLIIVFVTAYIEYAPSGYKVNAFRYILKNKVDAELEQILDEIHEKLYFDADNISLKQKDQDMVVSIKNISYLEGTSHRMVVVHTSNSRETFECLGKLSDFEEILKEKGFLRVQKSFLVNMQHIRQISGYNAYMDNGQKIKTSESNYADICSTFLKWKGKHL